MVNHIKTTKRNHNAWLITLKQLNETRKAFLAFCLSAWTGCQLNAGLPRAQFRRYSFVHLGGERH